MAGTLSPQGGKGYPHQAPWGLPEQSGRHIFPEKSGRSSHAPTTGTASGAAPAFSTGEATPHAGAAHSGERTLAERRLETPEAENAAREKQARFLTGVDALIRGGRRRAQMRARGAVRHPNGTEGEFRLYIAEHFRVGALFEALTFRLPGGSRYTPDWVTFGPDKQITCFEVKGSYRLGSHGRALTAFRECRAVFPMVKFRWFEKQKGGGFVERYPDPWDEAGDEKEENFR
jgi:hypothetical protein